MAQKENEEYPMCDHDPLSYDTEEYIGLDVLNGRICGNCIRNTKNKIKKLLQELENCSNPNCKK